MNIKLVNSRTEAIQEQKGGFWESEFKRDVVRHMEEPRVKGRLHKMTSMKTSTL